MYVSKYKVEDLKTHLILLLIHVSQISLRPSPKGKPTAI